MPRPFRGRKTAASLKLNRGSHVRGIPHPFRGRKTAASLKHAH